VREAAPILLAGLDHSGKTALRGMLEAHPAIHIVRHVELWTRLRSWFATGPDGRQRVLAALTRGKAAALGLDRDRLAAAASDGDFGALVREIGLQVCERAGTSRWGLQEALLEFTAAGVLEEVPKARIIQLVRDPRDRYAEMHARGAVGRGGLAAETAAWIASARAAVTASAQRPDAFRVVRHEDLLADPTMTLRDVCDFIGEPFVPAMVRALPAPVGGPPAERDVAFVQAHAAPEMLEHGYALQPVMGRAGMLRGRLVDASRWQLGRLSWRRRTRHLRPWVGWGVS
jgi:hypothetical protein